jgi:hypothetical protein
MGRKGSTKRTPVGGEQRGLWRLMLKLPALRGRLQVLAAKSESLGSLCEAYEDASVTLDRLRNAPGDVNCPMVREYEILCAEIEADVIQYCLQRGPSGPD